MTERLAEGASRADSRVERASKVVIAGHDLKFLASIPEHVRASGAELREDVWDNRAGPPTDASRHLLDWADTVLCEWCLGNAVWYSRRARPEQRVVIRLHRVELETDFPAEVALEHVDHVVFVGDQLLDEAVAKFGWARDRLRVIPNTIDHRALALPKLPDVAFNLGFVGYTPQRKRLDRALDLLERLRAREPRFRLLVKGAPPWETSWVWRRAEERRYFERVFARISASALLRHAVTFEPFGVDVPAFLQKVGFILSTSEHESQHLGLAEGMASGAIPVMTERPGAAEQYSPEWVYTTSLDAANAILAAVAGGNLESERRRVADFTRRWSAENVMPLWSEVLGLGPRGQ